MQVLSKSESNLRRDEVFEKIIDGKIFIHPTDTIYGLGCDATNKDAVSKIRKMKKREDDPFSIIAPSLKWIEKNCEVSKEAKEWIEKLPGPYTFIMKLKNPKAIAENVNPKGDTIGVRMPAHWITRIVSELQRPIITTSANQTGKDFMTSTEDLDSEIKKGLEFVMYEGEKKGRPSKLVHLYGDKVEVKER